MQVDQLREWVGKVRERLPRGTSYSDTVEAIAQALDGATGSQVIGVRIRGVDGDERELRGRLVVGADGHRSTVARLNARVIVRALLIDRRVRRAVAREVEQAVVRSRSA